MTVQKRQLLIIDSDQGFRKEISSLCAEYDTDFTTSRAGAMTALQKYSPGVVILEPVFPANQMDSSEGLAVLQEILLLCPETKVIIVTKDDDHETELKAINLGAHDCYHKPVDPEVLKLMVNRAYYLYELELKNKRLRTFKPSPLAGVIASSPQMLEICDIAARVAPTDTNVLLLGGSGTGKERIAQAIHKLSQWSTGNIVAINCAAIPETLLESELFGHEKGAFTGALSQKIGKIERADNGTLFLDEIGDLPLDLQTKLLRFIQERVIERVGGREEIPVNTRIVCATHRDLENMIASGQFREDLYYRISTVTLKIPALKDRDGDAILLANAILDQTNEKMKYPRGKVFSPEALRAIEAYSWPGNVRELENKIKRAVILSDSRHISAKDLDLEEVINGDVPSLNLREAKDNIERGLLRRALFVSRDNISEVAKLLGVTRPTVYKLIDKFQISTSVSSH